MEKQKHIFICTPMYGGQCTGVYAQSLINLIGVLGEHGYKTSVSLMFNESLVTRARCNMTYQFLESDADYLFWIDADIAFKAEDAIKMLQADKDVIGGIYPKRKSIGILLSKRHWMGKKTCKTTRVALWSTC